MEEKALLKTVCEDIYSLTGVKPVIYDADMHLVYAHPKSMGEFCRQIRRDDAAKQKCLNCDRAGFDRCRRTGQICIYRCHIGLTEAVAPILDGNSVIGYILFGQLLEENARASVAENIRANSAQYAAKLLPLLEEIPSVKREVICAGARLMSMCAAYIQLQNAVRLHRSDLIRDLSSYIRENPGSDLTIPALCKRFGISRGTLYTTSKQAFGMGITEYVRACRIDAAIARLRQTDQPVCRIAEAVGIPDANYLTKLIRQRTGLTPTGLRKQEEQS